MLSCKQGFGSFGSLWAELIRLKNELGLERAMPTKKMRFRKTDALYMTSEWRAVIEMKRKYAKQCEKKKKKKRIKERIEKKMEKCGYEI